MKKVLIVEDEKSISIVLKAYLTRAGYTVEQAWNGEQAMDLFEQGKPSLVLLDIMLPDTDGWTILHRIRERCSCPVIMLTALGDTRNMLTGLNGGADDYMSKPFIGEEVVARVHAVLRRQPQVVTDHTVTFGSLKIDYAGMKIFLNGNPVNLTPRDLALLLHLSKHPNQTFDREQLISSVWGIDYEGSDRAVDLAIKRIRQLLAEWPEEEGAIETFRRMGYQFRVRS
jgi:DNA-binding response OmpR family regulator